MIEKYLTDKRKVLFFVDSFKGGAGNVVQILARSFTDRGCKVTVCCIEGTTSGRHPLDGVDVIGVKSGWHGRLKFIDHIFKVKKIIKSTNPDCVISFLFGISAVVGAAVSKKRDYTFVTSERSNPAALKPHGIIKSMVRSAYAKADSIVVLFDAFKNLENSLFVDKCVTIPNPVPLMKPCASLSHEEVTFVTIANEGPAKGLDLLIAAFAKVIKEGHNAKLYIYGDIKSNLIPEMIASNSLEDNVILAGYTHDVEKVLSESDVYIMPSRHEGFPNSLCEAMSAGKACIAFECHAGIGELIQNYVNGVLVPKEDVDKMASEIKNLIDNSEKIKIYGDNARKISDIYNVNAVTDMWDSLLANIVNTR
ncbi:MAG: glycosyltransferase family 4 protein [Ruminococcaceae bacterium]|nr:glycosyltransferase family 4 protein [Oscillospiraceae bacterium]